MLVSIDFKNAALECQRKLSNANNDCKNVLGHVENVPKKVLDEVKNVPNKVGDFIGGIIGRRKRSPMDDICNGIVTNNFCKVIDISKLSIKAVPFVINFFDDLKNKFTFTINTDTSMSANHDDTLNGTAIIESIKMEFDQQFERIKLIISLVELIFLTPIAIILIRNYIWLGKYSEAKLREKNDVQLKIRAIEQAKLKKSSKKKNDEGLNKVKLMLVVCHILLTMSIICFDYSLFWVQSVVLRNSNVTAQASASFNLEIDYQAGEVFRPLVDQFISSVNLMRKYDAKFETEICLPNPTQPDFWVLIPVSIVYMLIVLVILFEHKLLSCRCRIVKFYFPHLDDKNYPKKGQLLHKFRS